MNESIISKWSENIPTTHKMYQNDSIVQTSIYLARKTSLASVLVIANPLLSLITLIVNIIVISIFTKKLARKPATIIIIAIAISDTFTGLTISALHPFYKLYITNGNSIKYPMCVVERILLWLHHVFHSISTFYTTTLGVQRFIVIACPFRGPRYVTNKTSYICVLVLTIFILLLNSPMLYPFIVTSYRPNGDTFPYVEADICISNIEEKVNRIFDSYFYYSNPVITVLCCFLMLTISIYLAVNFHCNKMLSTRSVSAKERMTRKRNTIMILMVLIIFIIAELPRLITFWCYSGFYITGDVSTCRFDIWIVLLDIQTLCFQVGACLNILIYILMSREFRLVCSSMLCYLCRCRGNINRQS